MRLVFDSLVPLNLGCIHRVDVCLLVAGVLIYSLLLVNNYLLSGIAIYMSLVLKCYG